ncbi:MAG TPA: rhamnan synthesis F family protein [Acetobacteraceae bacterium]|nr:rhamnan synthesis F family protein [Acetobacteraceae bacterium]
MSSSRIRRYWRFGRHILHTRVLMYPLWLYGYLRPHNRIIRTWQSDSRRLGPRVAVFCHYDRAGRINPAVRNYLVTLERCGLSIVFVTNAGFLRPDAMAFVRELCAAVIIRGNVGYDFGAWRDGLAQMRLPRAETEAVFLANDSVYGPIQPFEPVFARIDFGQADAWGLTDSWQSRYHLQSFFLGFNRKVLDSDAWRGFWRSVHPVPTKYWIIKRCEVGLTQRLLRAGFHCEALWPYHSLISSHEVAGLEQVFAVEPGSEMPFTTARSKHALRILSSAAQRDPLNPTNELWRQLLHAGFPFIKRELLSKNPTEVEDIADWRDVLARELGVDTAPILDELQYVLRNRTP